MSDEHKHEHEVSDEHEGDPNDCWGAAQSECDVCGYSWTAVYPMCCQLIECPRCSHMTRAPHVLAEETASEPEQKEPWQS